MIEEASHPAVIPDGRAPNVEFTSGSAQIAAIFRLNHDLLWRIFSLNTIHRGRYAPVPKPLSTLQHTSQVCSSWRALILTSSSLWGQVIDVGLLGKASEHWVNEVISRTGQAWLYVTDSSRSPDIWPVADREKHKEWDRARNRLLESLFKHHWTRIRSVEVETLDTDFVPTFEDLLQQPASFLEAFDVPFFIDNPEFRLFANHAPALQEFHMTSMPFNPEASWLSHLRSFHLSEVCSISLYQLLDAFTHMPCLEYLGGITQWSLVPLDEKLEFPLPKAVLHQLTTIYLNSRGNMRACLALLDHITPSPGCCLSFTVSSSSFYDAVTYTEQEIAALRAIFSRYSKNYFKIHSIRRVYIRIFARGVFDIKADDFRFRIMMISPDDHSAFVKSFFSDSNLLNFLSSLDTVETLDAPGPMLQFIANIPKEDEVTILPSLLRVNLLSEAEADDPFAIFSFLEWIRKSGLRMHSHNLPLSRMVSQDFPSLEEVSGVVIMGYDGEYECFACGSGMPVPLTFPGSRIQISVDN